MERPVKGRAGGVGAKAVPFMRRAPGIIHAIDAPGHAIGVPFDFIDMEVIERARHGGFIANIAVVRRLPAEMDGAEHAVFGPAGTRRAGRAEIDRLHDVDFARGRPGAIVPAFRQHPDGGPCPLTRWQFSAHLHLAIEPAGLAIGGQARRGERLCVGRLPLVRRGALVGWEGGAAMRFAPGDDRQQAICDAMIGGGGGVALPFLIAAAPAIVGKVPFGGVE